METGPVKYKLQQETVKKIVDQLAKGSKVEFDSGLMTVEDFMHCFNAAKSISETKNTEKTGAKSNVANLPHSTEGAD